MQGHRRDIVFDDVAEFTRRAFPGLLFDDREAPERISERYSGEPLQESTWTIGTLGLDASSERARSWANHFGNARVVNRYVVHFLSENVEIEVFARSFSLSDERRRDA